ncbi:regulation of nuclear pre-mRNA domain-containing protein 2 [Tachyglossus aculeatus]|uniref:regulation of nuclear pre-mRNA domain-containing protein 2 n=1 Tax=Tachyglossus aculeatus TaxID=9261 RepID=UPI0018F3BE5F|nr:regulation of nuclear pre-mRNA domain-containing protein 2 [Tachyglossus aculeatus]
MESIQGLSSWCIENKKHHGTIVYHWMKWLRRSAFPHRLNLFYLANDVIQNCKRKNAIVFREAFAEVLPEAAALVKDPSVSKSIERIFKIWEERNVYPEDTIVALKEALSSTFKTQKQLKDSLNKPPNKPWKKTPTSSNPKAALKSKIVAEFRSQTLIDELLLSKRSEDQMELKEKQLATMRVDVCSTETLKCLKDKTGGKKFSKEFEEASSKLEEFVNGLDKQVKNGPSLTEALENAGIFYEAQYKEVKVVANAYKTFANRVSNLKKKLDQLKSTLPDPEESPVPSPSVDAPSPTGSESPFQGMGGEASPSPAAESEKSGSPAPATDNRDVEDMELSDVEDDTAKIIVEDRKEKPAAEKPAGPAPASAPVPAKPADCPPKAAPGPPAPTLAATSPTPPPPKPATPAPLPPSPALALPNLANVDLAKISSILSSLTSVMKNTGVSPASRPSPSAPTSPSALTGGPKAPAPAPAAPPNPLANILSKVDITPESILSALSKTQAQAAPGLQGLSSLLQSVTGAPPGAVGEAGPQSGSAGSPASSLKGRPAAPCAPAFGAKSFGYSPDSEAAGPPALAGGKAASPGVAPSFKPPANSLGFAGPLTVGPAPAPPAEGPPGRPPEAPPGRPEAEPASPSLEMKIHNFLKGNPGFSGLNLNIPNLGGLGAGPAPGAPADGHPADFPRGPALDNVDGTPVRDERGGTPTQDEMMDKPPAGAGPGAGGVDPVALLSKIISPGSSTPSSTRSPGRDPGYGPSEPPGPASGPGSPRDDFYPAADAPFREDEDYRDFEYSRPAAPEGGGALADGPSGYRPIPPSYGRPRGRGFGPETPFPPAVRALLEPAEGRERAASSPGLYGAYGPDRSPPPGEADPFFGGGGGGGRAREGYPDSPPAGPARPLFSAPAADKVPASALSATSTTEFKNMLKNASSRKPSDDGGGKRFGPPGEPQGGPAPPAEERYRIETRVSSSASSAVAAASCPDPADGAREKGEPIETLGYRNAASRRMSGGEPIQTVESIRVLGKGGRGPGREGARGASWFELSGPGGAFDNGPSAGAAAAAAELPSLGGFKAPPYKERGPPFADGGGGGVNSFRPNSFAAVAAFDRHLPPPPLVEPPKEHGGLFARDRLAPPAEALAHAAPPPPPGAEHGGGGGGGGGVPFPGPPPPPPGAEHAGGGGGGGGVPFSGPPPVDHGGVGVPFPAPPLGDLAGVAGLPLFSKEHAAAALLPAALKERFGVLPAPPRDLNGPALARARDGLGLPGRGGGCAGGGPAPPRDAGAGAGGLVLRSPRPDFRPRDPFLSRDPFHSLKRPRPPFARAPPPFFAPKRPFFPPRY